MMNGFDLSFIHLVNYSFYHLGVAPLRVAGVVRAR
jgi:hypothetical protein